jgi:hypothetical protein
MRRTPANRIDRDQSRKIPLASFNRSIKAVIGNHGGRKDQWNYRFPGVWR